MIINTMPYIIRWGIKFPTSYKYKVKKINTNKNVNNERKYDEYIKKIINQINNIHKGMSYNV